MVCFCMFVLACLLLALLASDVDETGMSDRFGWHYGKSLLDEKW